MRAVSGAARSKPGAASRRGGPAAAAGGPRRGPPSPCTRRTRRSRASRARRAPALRREPMWMPSTETGNPGGGSVWSNPNRESTPSTSIEKSGAERGLHLGAADASLPDSFGLKAGALESDGGRTLAGGAGAINRILDYVTFELGILLALCVRRRDAAGLPVQAQGRERGRRASTSVIRSATVKELFSSQVVRDRHGRRDRRLVLPRRRAGVRPALGRPGRALHRRRDPRRAWPSGSSASRSAAASGSASR